MTEEEKQQLANIDVEGYEALLFWMQFFDSSEWANLQNKYGIEELKRAYRKVIADPKALEVAFFNQTLEMNRNIEILKYYTEKMNKSHNEEHDQSAAEKKKLK